MTDAPSVTKNAMSGNEGPPALPGHAQTWLSSNSSFTGAAFIQHQLEAAQKAKRQHQEALLRAAEEHWESSSSEEDEANLESQAAGIPGARSSTDHAGKRWPGEGSKESGSKRRRRSHSRSASTSSDDSRRKHRKEKKKHKKHKKHKHRHSKVCRHEI